MNRLLIGKALRGPLPGKLENFDLPLDLTTQTLAVLAKKGAGKSYTSSVMIEELLDAGQVPVILDPTGAWFGLKSSADGKSAGYPMVIFGGEHADLPLEETAGEATARAIVEQRFPAIIDLSLFRKGQVKRFVTPFLETLYRLNRLPLMLVVDEADDICPQRPFGDEAQMVGALEDVVKRGRKKGIGCTLITQRPADLAKQVLTQCEMLVAMRLTHPLDIKAVMEWVNVHSDGAQADKMVKSLPSLPIGTAWFWSPGWGDIFEMVKVRTRRTFDSGATPKAGEKVVAPKQFAQVDLTKLGEQIRVSVERAKDNDPAELKKKIATLEREIAKKVSTPERVEVPVFTKEEIAKLDKVVEELSLLNKQLYAIGGGVSNTEDNLEDLLKDVVARLKNTPAARKPFTPPPHEIPAVSPESRAMSRRRMPTSGTDSISPGLRRVMIAMAKRPGLTNRQIGIRSGISINSSTFRAHLASLRKNEWLRDEGDHRYLTDAGVAALGAYTPLPEGRDLLEHWLRELPPGAAGILRALADAAPNEMNYDQMAYAGGTVVSSSTFRAHLAKLRALELIKDVTRGMCEISEELT
jgi:hypothetical protein